MTTRARRPTVLAVILDHHVVVAMTCRFASKSNIDMNNNDKTGRTAETVAYGIT